MAAGRFGHHDAHISQRHMPTSTRNCGVTCLARARRLRHCSLPVALTLLGACASSLVRRRHWRPEHNNWNPKTADPRNGLIHDSADGGSFATFDAMTLTPEQRRRADELWANAPAWQYACRQHCDNWWMPCPACTARKGHKGPLAVEFVRARSSCPVKPTHSYAETLEAALQCDPGTPVLEWRHYLGCGLAPLTTETGRAARSLNAACTDLSVRPPDTVPIRTRADAKRAAGHLLASDAHIPEPTAYAHQNSSHHRRCGSVHIQLHVTSMRQASQSALEFPEPTGRSIHAEADTFARRNYGGDYARGRTNPLLERLVRRHLVEGSAGRPTRLLEFGCGIAGNLVAFCDELQCERAVCIEASLFSTVINGLMQPGFEFLVGECVHSGQHPSS